MERRNMENLIKEVVEDLENKAKQIKEAAETPDIATREQLQEVRDEAARTLFRASDAIRNASMNLNDPKQILEGLKVALDRSQSLYEQTMERIREIKGIDGQEGPDEFPFFPETEESVEKEDEIPEVTEAPETEEEAEEIPDEVTLSSHEILEGWFLPESEDK